jgi:NADH dehydrogenase
VLVRPGSTYQPLVDAGAQAVFGDLKDRASLEPACADMETVITTANSAQRGGSDNPQTVDLEGNRNLIDAARAAGVQQFIFTSALGVDPNSPVPFVRAKGQTESYLRESGVPFTILAPNIFMEVWMGMVIGLPLRAGRPVTLVGEGRRRHSFVAARDVAAFAVAAVGHPAALNRRVVLGGPEALSLRDVVAAYERALGHPIPVRTIAPGELLPDLPPVPGLAEVVSGMVAALETFETPIDMAETARSFGVQLTTLEEFVRVDVANDARVAA